MQRAFTQVDVFTTTPYAGNPVAVVLDGSGLGTEEMQRFANWTNLSETTFVLPPTVPEADYLVRIFTPVQELPFAGHPTLGTCHAWLTVGGGTPKQADVVVQECAAGLIEVRQLAHGFAFAAPPLKRSGPVDEDLLQGIATAFGVDRTAILDAEWADNGPPWIALLFADSDAVLALKPGFIDLDIGVVGPRPDGSQEAIEVRTFFPKDGTLVEDPVTGQLQRLSRAMAPAHRARTRAVHRPPGDGPRPFRARAHLHRRRRSDLGRRRHHRLHHGDGRALATDRTIVPASASTSGTRPSSSRASRRR